MKTEESDLVSVETIRLKMVLPTTGTAIPERSMTYYIAQLGIQVHLKKIKDKGHGQRHVTKADAERLHQLFLTKHWRKFKAAEKK